MEGIDGAFSKWLRREHNHRRMTQPELAYRGGVSRSVIANIEGGHQKVSLSTFCSIIQGLGLKPSDVLGLLYSDMGNKLPNKEKDLKDITKQISEILETWQ